MSEPFYLTEGKGYWPDDEGITMKSEVLASRKVTTAQELLDALEAFMPYVRSADQTANEVIAFGGAGEPLRIRLIEDTLTDGSTVFSVHIEWEDTMKWNAKRVRGRE